MRKISKKTVRTCISTAGLIIVAVIGFKSKDQVINLIISTPTPIPIATESIRVSSTEVPTEVPTEKPTEVPTEKPTEVPTEKPTEVPTEKPTEVPTEKPTEVPTEVPTEKPTTSPVQDETTEVDIQTLKPIIGSKTLFWGSGGEANYGTERYKASIWCDDDGTGITYPIDGEYSIIKGDLALEDFYNDSDSKYWVEFYDQDGKRIGKTRKLTAGVRPIQFEFSIKGVIDLKVVPYSSHGTTSLLTNGFFLVKSQNTDDNWNSSFTTI